jgi:hypothetical protein
MAPAYDAADDDELIGEDPFEEPAAKRIVMLVSVRRRARTAPPPHSSPRAIDGRLIIGSTTPLPSVSRRLATLPTLRTVFHRHLTPAPPRA